MEYPRSVHKYQFLYTYSERKNIFKFKHIGNIDVVKLLRITQLPLQQTSYLVTPKEFAAKYMDVEEQKLISRIRICCKFISTLHLKEATIENKSNINVIGYVIVIGHVSHKRPNVTYRYCYLVLPSLPWTFCLKCSGTVWEVTSSTEQFKAISIKPLCIGESWFVLTVPVWKMK